MTGLKILNVSYNAIADVPKKTFPKLYELHTVDLSHNNVSIIANGVFQTLFSLRYLNLSYNQLDKIKPSTFGALSTLLELDLSNNILTDVSKGSLASLSSASYISLENNMLENLFQIPISLSRLNLRKNWLMEIPENTWPVMNALLTLDLGKNRMSNNLRGGAFAGLLTLQTLFLNDNGITFVPKESIANLNTLQYLHLEVI
jgi:Leucine-rich repeat (LRR) protein